MADSIEQKWWAELAKMLRTIRKTDGYEHDVCAVYEEVIPLGQIQEFTAITMEMGLDTCLTSQSGKRTTGLLEWSAQVFLDCYVKDGDEPQKQVRKIKQDLLRLLYRDLYGAGRGYSLNGTCFEVYVVSADAFGTTDERPIAGVTIELMVRYNHNITNPTQKA